MNENHQVNYEGPRNHNNSKVKETNAFIVVGQILTIISAVMWCITIIGLIWGIPMIMGCMKRLSRTKEITIAHVILSILFFWLLGGILTLIGAVQEQRI